MSQHAFLVREFKSNVLVEKPFFFSQNPGERGTMSTCSAAFPFASTHFLRQRLKTLPLQINSIGVCQKSELNNPVAEKGHIFFFFRPKRDKHEAHSLEDVQRFYTVLEPFAGSDSKCNRIIQIGRKFLPDIERHQKHWAFVEKASENIDDIKSTLKHITYHTRSGEERELEGSRPVGCGVYAITEKDRHTHLVYVRGMRILYPFVEVPHRVFTKKRWRLAPVGTGGPRGDWESTRFVWDREAGIIRHLGQKSQGSSHGRTNYIPCRFSGASRSSTELVWKTQVHIPQGCSTP
jgi:hypothetical protein